MARVEIGRYHRPVPEPGRKAQMHLLVLGFALEWLFLLLLLAIAAACAFGIWWTIAIGEWELLYVRFLIVTTLGAIALSVIPCFLVVRRAYRPFGFEVRRGTHTRLWDEIDRVAKDLRAKSPDRIFLDYKVNAAAFEAVRLFGLQKIRIMVIGLGEMSIATLPMFRATLAHELAHFSGGDTAFNGWLIRTSQRLRMLSDEETPIAIRLLVRIYIRLFAPFVGYLRRRQEFNADYAAARYVGRTTAIEALREGNIGAYLQEHFFDNGGMNAVHDGVNFFAAFRVYVDSAREQNQFPVIEKRVGQIPPKPDDHHPTYAERLAYARRLPDKPADPDRRLARELLDDPDRVEAELTRWMKAKLDLL